MSSVFVGLSGGVDSAVSAALLTRAGHDVTGVFIKIWQPEFVECTWRRDRLDAMRVCAHLRIPFCEVDLSGEYKREVADMMTQAYARGETPNPDILCNTSIKFGHFLRWALAQGAHSVATGHYARVEEQDGAYRLLRGVDAGKDQSYFLSGLSQEELAHALFPVGGMEKSAVREHARRFRLPNAARPDSQGLCFVGDVSMRDFLGRFIPLAKGDVLDMQGNIIGVHDGAALYTRGERHGFSAASREPLFVVRTDVAKNAVIVSPGRADAMTARIALDVPHWIGKEPMLPLSCNAQVRYRGDIVRATVACEGGVWFARFETPQIAAPGQSLVMYDGDECIGNAVMRGD